MQPQNKYKGSGSLQRIKGSGRRTVKDLLGIMARLRSPSGCPWDREQTEQTLKKFLIEEAYETLEAIEAGTSEALKEELGDLLLQIIFLSRLAEERKAFDFSDVVHTLAEKLIHRHPHVFPPSQGRLKEMRPKSARDVIKIWGMAKELEGKYSKRKSLIDGLPLALPALERSRRLSQRISRAGIDWPAAHDLCKRAEKELGELKRTMKRSRPKAAEEKFGDFLFTLVNWARSRGITAEEALRNANRRFVRRFRRMEAELKKQGKTLKESDPEGLDRLWSERKKKPG